MFEWLTADCQRAAGPQNNHRRWSLRRLQWLSGSAGTVWHAHNLSEKTDTGHEESGCMNTCHFINVTQNTHSELNTPHWTYFSIYTSSAWSGPVASLHGWFARSNALALAITLFCFVLRLRLSMFLGRSYPISIDWTIRQGLMNFSQSNYSG